MNRLEQYTKIDDYIIAYVIDEDSKVLGFTVADRNCERAVEKNFATAGEAIRWADKNYRDLV